MASEIYDKTVFKRFFEVNDPKVLAWAENVLAKICGPGILPVYLNKEGEDFKSFWGTITHLFALVVIYGRQYNEIDTNKILFELFIENRGLVTNEIDTQEQMQYLFDNYINEYKKRGRLDIVSKEGVILGELLRLIQYDTLDEFIFALLMARDSGWTLGYSSPTWNRTDTVTNITKGYEVSENVENLSAYPLINATGVTTILDQSNTGQAIQAMTFVGNVLTGIGSTEDQSKLLIVSEDLPYQISCKLKVSDITNQNLTFGVQVYDELKRPMSLIEAFGTTESNEFTSGDGGVQLINNGIYYELRATISKKNRTFTGQLPLNFSNGRGLKMVEGVRYLSMYLVQDRSKPCSDVYVYDIKIKPLYLPFIQGYLGEKNIIAAYYENKSSSSNSTINAFIETYLVSYKNVLKSSVIVPIEKTLVYFKVFSDRRVYLENAKITIAGQTLTTDINGEASLEIYPGDYLYSVELDKFIPIEDEVLSVLEEEQQIVYVSLQGNLYERKVIFSVRDENNVAIAGATVTFNGKFQNTGLDGTTSFMAYPGLHSYKVTKDKYYVINKSVLVSDDMVENVTMELIPVSTITFVVKNGTTPISGVQITLASKQPLVSAPPAPGQPNSSNSILTKTTDENGQAVFTEVVNGSYSYSAEKVDWLPVNEDLEVNGDQTVNIAFNPVPTYTITFLVNDYNVFTGTKAPIAGATVVYAGIIKQTDSSGNAAFIVKGNSYSYTISLVDHDTVTGNYRATQDATIPIDLPRTQYTTTIKVVGINNVPLSNAAVTIEGKTQQTDSKGITEFQLPNGNYSYRATYNEYHPKEGNFVVNRAVQTITIPMDQVLYNVTFTVKEENVISVGATVNFGDQSKTTSNQGIAVFQVPRGSYQWTVSKNIYVTQSGNVDVVGSAVTREINLIRKNGTVNFYVKNDSGQAIESATVVCGGQTRTTNVNGQAVFTLPIADYSYDVSKLPDYTSQTGNVSVKEREQTVDVLLSNKTYTVTFNVTVYWGSYNNNQVYNVPVTFNGRTVYTNSSGKAVFSDVRNGNYDYTVANGSSEYVPQSGSLVVSNYDTSKDIQLNFRTTTSTIYVRRDGQSVSGVSLRGAVKYKNGYGGDYATISGSTNSSGYYTVTCPASGYFYVETEDNLCRNISSGNVTNGNDTYLYLFRAFILTFNTSAQSIINSTSWLNSSNAEANGNTLKVCPAYSGSSTPSNLSSGCTFEGKTSLLSVDQWPISWGFSSGDYMFSGCSSLNSVVSGSPRINESIVDYFRNCSSLRSIPTGFFTNVSGSDARNCCRNSGVSEAPSNLFSNSISYYEYCFADCSRLTTASSRVFGAGGSEIGGVFMNCTSLSSVDGNVFYNCDYVTSIAYCFTGCTNLRSIPSNLFRYTTRVTNARGVFSGCNQLQALPASLFNYITALVDFTTVCYQCTNLSSIGSNAFPTSVKSFNSAFKGCSSLRNADNVSRVYQMIESISSMFEESGLTSIKSGFFKGCMNLLTATNTFKNCTSLTTVNTSNGNELFNQCIQLRNLEGLFNGCISMNSVSMFLFENNSKALNNITTYVYLFYNCRNANPPFATYNGTAAPLYTIIDLMISEGKISPNRSGAFRGATKILNSGISPSSAWR